VPANASICSGPPGAKQAFCQAPAEEYQSLRDHCDDAVSRDYLPLDDRREPCISSCFRVRTAVSLEMPLRLEESVRLEMPVRLEEAQT
jgi:hypothetical protein